MQRVIWVHGIGDHKPGYSLGWQRVFDPALQLPSDAYHEVLWESVFETGRSTRHRAAGPTGPAVENPLQLTRAEQASAAELTARLEAILQARQDALLMGLAASPAAPGRRATVRTTPRRPATAGRLLPFWLKDPGEYLGDFTRYLVNQSLRTAVKECFKQQLRPLAGSGDRLTVIAHSWGTVVAYEALLDLAIEEPNLAVANLITLGSPLWLVRGLLQQRSGRRPSTVAAWTNIHALFDLVGSWLRPGFRVTGDYQVPSVGNDPHGSYFAEGNQVVQQQLIAPLVR